MQISRTHTHTPSPHTSILPASTASSFRVIYILLASARSHFIPCPVRTRRAQSLPRLACRTTSATRMLTRSARTAGGLRKCQHSRGTSTSTISLVCRLHFRFRRKNTSMSRDGRRTARLVHTRLPPPSQRMCQTLRRRHRARRAQEGQRQQLIFPLISLRQHRRASTLLWLVAVRMRLLGWIAPPALCGWT